MVLSDSPAFHRAHRSFFYSTDNPHGRPSCAIDAPPRRASDELLLRSSVESTAAILVSFRISVIRHASRFASTQYPRTSERNGMSESKSAKLYDKQASTAFYDDRYAHGYMDDWPIAKKEKIQEVLLSLNLPQEGTALDFGCGTGVLTELIAQTLPGWTVFGTDLSTVAIAIARQRYGKRQFFAPGDSEFAGRIFDLVVSHHVLEHVYDIVQVLDEIGSYLKPKAAMLHILPCGNKGSFCHRLCKMRNGGIDPQLGNRFFFEDEGHVRRLTTDELANLCARQGFELKRDYYTGHHYGAIDYFTKIEPHLIPRMTDWSQGIDAEAKRKIFWLALYLRGIAACRSFAGKFEKKWWQAAKSPKDWLRLSLALPPYLIVRAIDRRVTAKALEEWNTKRSDRNGDQMFLYVTRKGFSSASK